MTLDLLRSAGEAAFGSDWQRPMARALGVFVPLRGSITDRQVRRWVAGTSQVPEWLPAILPALLRREADGHDNKAAALRAVADRMEKNLKEDTNERQ